MSEEGSSIQISELSNIYGQTFSKNDIADKKFNQNDLQQGYLYIKDVLPGNITVVNNEGQAMMVDQREKIQGGVCVGVIIDLSGVTINGTWKIRYNRGVRGQAGISNANMPKQEDLIKYAILFG